MGTGNCLVRSNTRRNFKNQVKRLLRTDPQGEMQYARDLLILGETPSGASLAITRHDCSVTLTCGRCGEKLCPGCRMQAVMDVEQDQHTCEGCLGMNIYDLLALSWREKEEEKAVGRIPRDKFLFTAREFPDLMRFEERNFGRRDMDHCEMIIKHPGQFIEAARIPEKHRGECHSCRKRLSRRSGREFILDLDEEKSTCTECLEVGIWEYVARAQRR